MILPQCSVCLLAESAQTILCLSCLAIAVHSLKIARRAHRGILASGENHGADVYSRARLFDKWGSLVVQSFSVIAALNRMMLLWGGHQIAVGFIVTGMLRTCMSIIIAAIQIVNLWAYRKLN